MIKNIGVLILLLGPLLLSGCSSTPDESVVKFVAEVKKTNPGYAQKSIAFSNVEPVKFDSSNINDPFEAVKLAKKESHARYPLGGRAREALESFPIEVISMVGTLEKEHILYALLKDPSGIVHIVGLGNYVGENSGKIEAITDTEISIKELTPDGKGGWRAHQQKIHFAPPDKATGGGAAGGGGGAAGGGGGGAKAGGGGGAKAGGGGGAKAGGGGGAKAGGGGGAKAGGGGGRGR